MKKFLLIPLSALAFLACNSSEESGEGTTENSGTEEVNSDLIVVTSEAEYTDKHEIMVEDLYARFDELYELDNVDASMEEFNTEIAAFEKDIETAEAEMARIQPYGTDTKIFTDGVEGAMEGIRQNLEFFKANVSLLSRPDSEWSDEEMDNFIAEDEKRTETMENAISDMYEARNDYNNAQP